MDQRPDKAHRARHCAQDFFHSVDEYVRHHGIKGMMIVKQIAAEDHNHAQALRNVVAEKYAFFYAFFGSTGKCEKAAGESIYPDVTPNAPIGKATRDDFSEMDLMILRKMVSGLNNNQIAEQVGLSADGVRYHIKAMLKKTDLPNRVALIVHAVRFGIVVKE